MAERERRSKPRELEPVEEEEESYNWWQLAMYLVAAVGVIMVMGIVSMFLSGNDIPPWLYYGLVASALVAGIFWAVSWFTTRKR